MGFIKSDVSTNQRTFKTFLEAQKVLEDDTLAEAIRLDALHYLLGHNEVSYVLEILLKSYCDNQNKDHALIDYAFLNFKTKPKRDDDYVVIYKILKSSNAYLRSKVITFLQDYGKEAKSFIEKLLRTDDLDSKIFAINILGDIKYENSRDMLIQIIKKESDVNVVMTAVDYLGDIGEKEDIDCLEQIKEKFLNNEYVDFGINLALKKIKG